MTLLYSKFSGERLADIQIIFSPKPFTPGWESFLKLSAHKSQSFIESDLKIAIYLNFLMHIMYYFSDIVFFPDIFLAIWGKI